MVRGARAGIREGRRLRRRTRFVRLTALAVARAMLAGRRTGDGLTARMHACLQSRAPWCADVAARCAAMPGERWRRLTVKSLATLIQDDLGFQDAWRADERPYPRRYLLREARVMQPLPVGLEACQVPAWPHDGALAAWLGIPVAGLWRLTRPAPWQRRRPLGEQHYRAQLMPKRTGGWRLLEVPAPYLMPLQRRVLDDLLDRIPPHEAARGFTRERSVVDHAAAHCGQAVVLRFDLRDFFPSVRASQVHALFETLGYPENVARTLTALCTTATPEPVLQRLRHDGGFDWETAQRLREPHLPQGSPTSPALANLCAFRLDLRLDGLATGLGARYTRYADDLVFSGPVHLKTAFARIERRVMQIVADEGFALNPRKTRCTGRGRRQQVCGIVVNAHPNLPRDAFDRLKAILHACARDGPAIHNREGHADWRSHLRGRVAWAAQLNPARGERLARLFERIAWPA